MKVKLNYYFHTSPPLKSILIDVNSFFIISYFGKIYFNIILPLISQVVYSETTIPFVYFI
jgi:hypothetical protein